MVSVVIATIPQQARVAIIIMVSALLKMEASRGRKDQLHVPLMSKIYLPARGAVA